MAETKKAKSGVKFSQAEGKLIKSAFRTFEEKFGILRLEDRKNLTLIKEAIEYHHDKGHLDARGHELMWSVFKKLEKISGEPVITPQKKARAEEDAERKRILEEKAKRKEAAAKIVEEKRLEAEKAKEELLEAKRAARLAEKHIVKEKKPESLESIVKK